MEQWRNLFRSSLSHQMCAVGKTTTYNSQSQMAFSPQTQNNMSGPNPSCCNKRSYHSVQSLSLVKTSIWFSSLTRKCERDREREREREQENQQHRSRQTDN